MSALAEERTVWRELSAARARHDERYRTAVDDYRHAFGPVLDAELERAARTLAGEEPLAAILAPLAGRLLEYLRWLRWSAWLSTQLLPPLGLVSARDRLRHAVAVVAYIGARLVDDGIDGHVHYKNKRRTLVAEITELFPHADEAGARCLSALTGFWILSYGERRMRQIGETPAADAMSRLYLRIPRGVLAEAMAGDASRSAYEAIVQHKSVAYDMLLYQSVLAPVPEGTRTALVRALATASQVAQYLNDLADAADDARRQQLNVILRSFETPGSVGESCLLQIEQALAALGQLEPQLRDVVAAIMAEVFSTSASLWSSAEPVA